MLETQQAWIRTLVLALDLCGTFVFALSGAAVGIRHKLDLFGVLVLSFVAATAGGIMRDVLLGATPPAAILDWRYPAVSVVAGLALFSSYPIRDRYQIDERLRKPILVFDAAGLALFAVAGALKALAFQLGPIEAVLTGVLTAVGGGVVRDVLVREVPTVLHSELYAVAALVGAGLVVGGRMLGLPSDATVAAGAVVCFGLRLIAVRRGWRLPTAAGPAISRSDSTAADRHSHGADRGPV
jgi:uncharacterized membrane protein YeiH